MVEAVARFAVPLFFLISGYFACDRDTGVIRRRAVHILRLYVGAVAVYYLWAAAQYALSQHTFVGMAAKLFPEGGRTVPELLLWNRTAMAPHLWFMGALVYCYLFDMVLMQTRWEEKAYWLIPVLLAVTLLIFTLLYFAPGDPARIILGDDAPEEAVAELREEMGFKEVK